MPSTLFLPLLLVFAVLPTVFCADTVPSTPHLIGHSRYGISEEQPFLAVVEPERHTSVKGATLEINGHEVGSVTAEDNYVTFELPSHLETEDDIYQELVPGQTTKGTGQIAYWPFRLDHNTVFDVNADPVEDNGWIFSFRVKWENWWGDNLAFYDCSPSENCNRADVYNTGWEVLFSFPTVQTIQGQVDNHFYGKGNLMIAYRVRDDWDELGVFLASDPTWLDPVDYEDEGIENGYPLAVFQIGGGSTDFQRLWEWERSRDFESYTLFVPMPDRVENSITVSFTAPYDSIREGEDDYFGAPEYVIDWFPESQSQETVTNGLQDLVWETVAKSYDYYADIYDYDQLQSDAFFYPPSTNTPDYINREFPLYQFQMNWDEVPDFGEPYGKYQMTITFPYIYPGAGLLVREFQSKFLRWVPTYLEERTGFVNIDVSTRVPGKVRSDDIVLWKDKQILEQYTAYRPFLPQISAFLRVTDGLADDDLFVGFDSTQDMWDQFWYRVDDYLFDSSVIYPPNEVGFMEYAFRGDSVDDYENAPVYAISQDDAWGQTYAFAERFRVSAWPWCGDALDYSEGAPDSNKFASYEDMRKAGAWYFEDFITGSYSSLLSSWDLTPFYPTDLPGSDWSWGDFGWDDDNYAGQWLELGYANRLFFDFDFLRGYDTGTSSCEIFMVIRLRDPGEEVGLWMQTNTDADANTDSGPAKKRQTVSTTNTGPLIVIGGTPKTVAGDTLQDFRGAAIGVSIADWKFFTVAGQNAASAVSESFLNTLIECGDGQLDAGEQCDSSDPTCYLDCTCPERSIPMAPLGCTYCGNGVIDYLKGEVCDYAEDPNCADDCMGCREEGMILDEEELPGGARKGRCTFCGNGVLDVEAGELCDSGSDSEHCMADCSGCASGDAPEDMWFPVGNPEGTCNQCGNGLVDVGEVCDIFFHESSCSSDCSTCRDGYIPVGDGHCTLCGNGKLDKGEACDPALTACMADCSACLNEGDVTIYVSRDGICSRCGNGYLDAGEECDPGTAENSPCAEDCSGCSAPYIPANDRMGSCTLCGNGVIDHDEDEVCDSDPNCVDCSDCRAPYVVSAGGACVLCGNGMLDAGEVCDALQEGCSGSCQSCANGFQAWPDMAENPMGLCYPETCEGVPSEDGECTCDQ